MFPEKVVDAHHEWHYTAMNASVRFNSLFRDNMSAGDRKRTKRQKWRNSHLGGLGLSSLVFPTILTLRQVQHMAVPSSCKLSTRSKTKSRHMTNNERLGQDSHITSRRTRCSTRHTLSAVGLIYIPSFGLPNKARSQPPLRWIEARAKRKTSLQN